MVGDLSLVIYSGVYVYKHEGITERGVIGKAWHDFFFKFYQFIVKFNVMKYLQKIVLEMISCNNKTATV